MSAVDVRRLQYMPLHLERLRRSKAWLRCKRRPEMAFYLMNLWMRAWHEFPAGSIEDDDDVLADAAMCDPDAWVEIREDVLRGWERKDGRLYHPVVTEIAAESATKLRGNKNRTEAARETLAQMRLDLSADSEMSVTDTVTGDEAEAEAEVEAEEEAEEESPAQQPTAAHVGGGGASLEFRLREAAGLVGDPSPALSKTGVVERLIIDGASLEHVILPAVRGVASEGRRGRSWAYYVGAIRDRLAGAALPAGAAPQIVLATVWVAEASPQGRAWEEHEFANDRKAIWRESKWHSGSGKGRDFPSLWPPGHPNHTPAREVA